MAEFDEVSGRIGALEGTTIAIKEHLDRIDEEADGHRKVVLDKLDSIGTTMTTHMAECATTKDKVEDLEPKVENHEKMKNRALGIVAGMSAAGGTLAAKITSIFTNT